MITNIQSIGYDGAPMIIRNDSDLKMKDIVDMFLLYEFTDKITLLTDNPAFPSLMNYVDQGILTEQELAEALAIQK